MSSEIEDLNDYQSVPFKSNGEYVLLLKEKHESLRQRLAEAEGLLREALSGLSPFIGFGKRITDFLNQKGGDVTDMNGRSGRTISMQGGDVTPYVVTIEQQKQRIAELERLYKAAMKSADDRLQAASAAEERAERAEKELAAQRDGAEAARAGRPISDCPYVSNAVSVEFRNAELQGCWQRGHDSATIYMLGGVEKITRELNSLRSENDQLKSVRVLSGNDLRDEWHNITEVDECDHWDRFAERLQLRCTCPPMSGDEMLEIFRSHRGTMAEFLAELSSRIWPKVAPKPTREEVAGRIVEAFRNDVLTVYTLDGKTAETRRVDYVNDRKWQSVIFRGNPSDSWSNDRTEAEQAAKEMLVDAVTENEKPVLTTVVQVVV